MRNSVLFPQPLAPNNVINSPFETDISIAPNTVLLPKLLLLMEAVNKGIAKSFLFMTYALQVSHAKLVIAPLDT